MALPSLGRTKTGRHRPVDAQQGEEEPGHELESYLAALAPDTDAETTLPGTRSGGSEVYHLRLSGDANEQLRELARRQDTSPQALAQEWFMQRLGWEADQQLGG